MKMKCDWCGSLYPSETPGSIIVGGDFPHNYNFCPSCTPWIKSLGKEYGADLFPDIFLGIEIGYNLAKQEGGDLSG